MEYYAGAYLIGVVIYWMIVSFISGFLMNEMEQKDFRFALIWPIALMHALGAVIGLINYNRKTKGENAKNPSNNK